MPGATLKRPMGSGSNVKHVAVVGPQALLHEAAGLQLQGAEVAGGAQLRRQMELDKVPGGIRMRQECLKSGVMGSPASTQRLIQRNVGRNPPSPRFFLILSALPHINTLSQRVSCGEIPYCSPLPG